MKDITVQETGAVMRVGQDIGSRFLSAQDIAPKSRETYSKAIKRFFSYLEEHQVNNVDRQDILDYKRELQDSGLSAYTVSAYITAVRRFFTWTETEKLYPNIAAGVKGGKKPKGFKKQPLTVSQIKRLLQRIDTTTIQGKRDLALLNLLIHTGLRTIEITRADVGDIQQQGGEAVLYIQGKGRENKDDFAVLTDSALKPLQDYLSSRKATPDQPLFTSCSDRNTGGRMSTRSISRIVKTRLQDIGIDDPRITAHSLRHTAVTLSLLGGASIQEAQRFARHSNINTTLIYAHNIDRIGKAPERKIDAMLSGVL
jgi:integrase/recombinase XerC/integrase/recombinase XerD